MVYVTDALMYAPQGKYITEPWWRMTHKSRVEVDAEQVIRDVVARAGIRVVPSEPSGPSSQDHVR